MSPTFGPLDIQQKKKKKETEIEPQHKAEQIKI